MIRDKFVHMNNYISFIFNNHNNAYLATPNTFICQKLKEIKKAKELSLDSRNR